MSARRAAGAGAGLTRSAAQAAEVLALGRATLAKIRANLAWALGYNLVAIPLAAGAALPAAGLALSPSAAGALMAFSSLAVVGNSLLLRGQARPAACSSWQTECACGRRRAGQRRAACCWRPGVRSGRPQLGLQWLCYSRKCYHCYGTDTHALQHTF